MKLNKAEIKAKILEEITKTEKGIADLKEVTKPISPENAIGRISRMDAINNKSINDAALLTAKNKLNKLQTALKQIDKDDFGICIKCRQPIPVGRIMLMPHANKCVNCA